MGFAQRFEMVLNSEVQGDIVCGDCLEVMSYIPDKVIDMVLCDLPYGTTQCKWDKIIPFKPLWEQYRRIIKARGAIVLTASQPFTTMLIASNMKMFKYCWVWVKTKASGHLDAKRKPMKKHEDIIVFGNKGHLVYYPQGLIDGVFKTGRSVNMQGRVYSQYKNHGISRKGNYPKSVLEFANPSGRGHLHPTQKPVALFEYLVKTYTRKGEIVLDNCMGSGTTAIAADRLGRRWFGCDTNPNYVKMSLDRIKQDRLKRSQLTLL